MRVDADDGGGGGSAGPSDDDDDGGGYCVFGVGSEVIVDDVVATCCCFAVNSTGIGSVNASSTLGNGPRGLRKQKYLFQDNYLFNLLLFSNSTFRYLSKT